MAGPRPQADWIAAKGARKRTVAPELNRPATPASGGAAYRDRVRRPKRAALCMIKREQEQFG